MKKIILAVVGAFTLLLGLTTTASAAYEPIEPDYDTNGKCSDIVFGATQPDSSPVVTGTELIVKIDSTGFYEHVPVGESITVERPTIDTEIQYRVWGGQERDYDSPGLTDEGLTELVAWLDADDSRSPVAEDAPGVEWTTLDVTGCPEEVAPEKPTVTQAECVDGELVPAVMNVPEIEGVSYDPTVLPDPLPLTESVVFVTATADDGYVLLPDGDKSRQFNVRVSKAPACDIPTETPSPTETPTDEPTTDPTSTETPSATPTPTETVSESPEPTQSPTSTATDVVNNCDAYVNNEGCDPGRDYDCSDIDDAAKPIELVDSDVDPFGLDGDGDGVGCEVDDSGVPNDEETDSTVVTSGDDLPDTGGPNPWVMAGLGLFALLAGAGAVTVQRRSV